MSRLSSKIKIMYGLGFSARGIKDGIFQLFLFFYFSQVLGLDPALAGLASILGLVVDAISDPIVGILSDRSQCDKWGRRHPFILASAIPLGLFIIILFMPPDGLGQQGLFWWMTVFSILVRLALTFFIVPHMSLGAELTTDYKERTSVTAIRIMFATILSAVTIIIGYAVFFPSTETYKNGLLNPEGYGPFAILCGALIAFFIMLSGYGTKSIIPSLPKASEAQRELSFKDNFKILGSAWKMRSFWSLVSFQMVTYISIGVGMILSQYFCTYFFEFTTEQLILLPIASALGGILSFIIAPKLGERLDKRRAAILSVVMYGLFFTMPFTLRLLGLFPDNDSSSVLMIYTATLFFAYAFLWVAFSLSNSMMADVIDEYELISGKRQEGVFFSTMSFAYKCTTGLGTFLAGILLSWIAFPTQVGVADVPTEAIRGLGIIGGPLLMFFYFGAIIFLYMYPITKARYLEIRRGIDQNNN